MQGSSEFTVGGVLADMNYTSRLSEIKNPVLLTSGVYDTMRPPTVHAMYAKLPEAWWAIFPHSGHCTMIDDPRVMNDLVGEFLDREEAGTLNRFRVKPGEVLFVAPRERESERELERDEFLFEKMGVEKSSWKVPENWNCILATFVVGLLGGVVLGSLLTRSVCSVRGSGRADLTSRLLS
eukprot:TRINITY_DN1901_c0_g1_i5.p1 TRINITY_DN1901_c0_g1~~TRINITY_DN1901_c0_g1_i5.p1  ORF type:complete len:180 (-),score=21.89 TRINITY_DN1901_c0_g1_i5:114-653(-)